MSNFGPCAKDCPNRKAGCSASCEAWNAVKGERLKSYDKRARIVDINQMADGGGEKLPEIGKRETENRRGNVTL